MLISEGYRDQQTTMHENPAYGTASIEYAPSVTAIVNTLKITDLLDYGAGKGRLAQSLRPDHDLSIRMYEPSVEEWADTPEPTEMVCCIDVLEHVEPECLDDVIADLRRVTLKYGFFTVHTGAARKTLPDGRNAHLTQEDYRWWLPKLWERFFIQSIGHTKKGFYLVVN